MEPNLNCGKMEYNYYKGIVDTYKSLDSQEEVAIIEAMASVPKSVKLAEKGIYITADGRCVSPRYARAVRNYCEKSGVLDTALNGINEVRTAEEANSVASEAIVTEVQVAER